MVSFGILTKYIYHRIELTHVAQTWFFRKDIFGFHINLLIGTSITIFWPMCCNCSCMYKLPSLAHLIEDLFFKFRNLHIELNKPSAFHTLDKMYFFWNQWKNKHYPKTCLVLFLPSGHKKFAKFSKAFHY
jgi:hypothetical protein